jgi:hypothetical protein
MSSKHLSVAVLLDIYHAKVRVIKEMSKYHPISELPNKIWPVFLQPFSNMAIFQHQMI